MQSIVLSGSLLYGVVLVNCLIEYRYIDLQLTWDEARQYCREHYIDLATLKNEDDVHRLNIPYAAWIGLFDDPASWRGTMTSDANSWRWSATGSTSPGGFQNWSPGDPSYSKGRESCVVANNGVWGDYDCANSFDFLCYTVQSSGIKDYVLINTRMNWTSAQAYCRQNHHDLAMIEKSAENQAVTDLQSNTSVPVGIGLYRIPWRWSDGSPSPHRKWGPSNSFGSEHCVFQNSAYVWNDVSCSGKYHFICYSDVITRATTNIHVQTTADLSDPAVRDKFLEVMESHLGAGFKPSWIVPPAKEEKKEKLHSDVCPAKVQRSS